MPEISRFYGKLPPHALGLVTEWASIHQTELEELWYKAQNKELTLAKESESESKYHTLFNNASIGILIADTTKMNFSFANPAICNMLGYSEEELTKMSVLDIHPKESLGFVISNFEAQAKKEKILATSLPCQRKNGSIFYADINTTSFTINETEYNVGFFTDISEKRSFDQKIQTQNKEYANLNEEYKAQNEELIKINKKADEIIKYNHALFHKSHTPLIVMDMGTYKYLDCNEAALKIYGYKKKEELIGKTPLDVSAPIQYNGEESSICITYE